MRTKLLNRFKAASTESEPEIRVVATQASTNILLTEPIHEDILPDLGDVTVRQMSGETSISIAYAVCIDRGIANIYRRKFPATMDYEWEFVWEYGEADDVAIEFDGEWTMDGSKEWYYLVTEEFPYIFTVESGNLYVQKWRDTSTRILLAEDVSNISACKGWFDYTNPDNDQGLCIGYIRDGEVYYRTLAYSTLAQTKVWEIEQKVEILGTGNSTLAVTRTNDFRLAFVTEQSGRIKMAITRRTYPGASVKPEYAHVSTYASFYSKPIRNYSSEENESAKISTPKTFFMIDPDDHRLAVTGAERIFSEDANGEQYCSGAIVYLDRPLLDNLTSVFVSRCTVSSARLSITDVIYDAVQEALVFSFAWNSGYEPGPHPQAFNITFPTCYDIAYDALCGQKWYVEGKTVSLEQIKVNRYGFENASASVEVTGASYRMSPVAYIYAEENHTAAVGTTSATFTFIPVGDIPV